MNNALIIIAGPTGVGKTATAIRLARELNTSIINADSRQVFREMVIGTAMPTTREQSEIKHYFLGHRSIHQDYDASRFENEVIDFLNEWFISQRQIIIVGGSGLYIDAVCRGIDDLPSVNPEIRRKIKNELETSGLAGIRERLKSVDPAYYGTVDINNPRRMMKALEVYDTTGRPLSSFLKGTMKKRNFNAIMIGLDIPRKELHERINNRVDAMMSAGLLDEVRGLYTTKRLNALNTVGYKELFGYIEGRYSLEEATANIKAHTRQYARRQLTWFRRYSIIRWFHPDDITSILEFIHHHPDGVGVPRRGVL